MMKKTFFLTFLLILPCIHIYAQEQEYIQGLMQIAELYSRYIMAPASDIKELDQIKVEKLKSTASFMKAALNGKEVLKDKYLTLPDKQTLLQVMIIDELHQIRSKQKPNEEVVKEIMKKKYEEKALINNYYRMLFTLVGNKVKPFDLSGYDFDMNRLSKGNKEYAAIFFLECMSMCGKNIWGLINIARNFKGALELIELYPTFNGKPYYQFTGLDLGEFEMLMTNGPMKYKPFYIGQYYQVLLSHVSSLFETDRGEEGQKIIKESIINQPDYYQYYPDPDLLRNISGN